MVEVLQHRHILKQKILVKKERKEAKKRLILPGK
jgi:hypothetical protein